MEGIGLYSLPLPTDSILVQMIFIQVIIAMEFCVTEILHQLQDTNSNPSAVVFVQSYDGQLYAVFANEKSKTIENDLRWQ